MNEELPPEVVEAIKHFQERAEKAIALEDLLKNTEFPQKIDFSDLPSLEARAKLYIKIAQARYEAGDISEHELAFHRCYAIEVQIHEARWSNGQYEDILGPIAEKMRAVEKSYGLSDDEYWPISEAPDEYKSLSKEYDLVMEQKLLEAFSEFGADDLRDLYINDPEEFYKLHDAGRVAVFQKDEHAKLKSIAIYYENEARVCEDAGSFLAAAVMLGSAIESRLILTCLENEAHIRKTLTTLGLTNRVLKSKNPLTWTLDTLIKVCSAAGWIPNYETGDYTFSGQAMMEFLKASRNQVHPKIKVKNKGLVVGEEQFKDIKFAHQLLSSTLNWPNNSSQKDADKVGASA
ncbi:MULTISPECIES: hypothetical protein [Shewanella]|uniref:HEPN domain-containing protein n=2 Tax=Bacteria TaxID=2 RepID=A0AAU6VTE2_UNCXX|nr:MULTISPECIES: hypothetical protein [Shewanella]MBO2663620.1 hypothetical protein [Shewanella algae]MCL1054221.1 hypothetical protein [Shewanella algae]MDE0566680.1 hypothetical protein [Shewanella sp. K8]